MDKINNSVFIISVDKRQVERVVNSVFQQKENGTLKPKSFWKNRKILFADDCELTGVQKLEICRKEFAIKCKNESEIKINRTIEDWNFEENGKITIRKVVKIAKMGNNTVTKYWDTFKSLVNDLNNDLKAETSPVTEDNSKVEQCRLATDKELITVLKEEINMSVAHSNIEVKTPIKMSTEGKCKEIINPVRVKITADKLAVLSVKNYQSIQQDQPTEINEPVALNQPITVRNTESLSGTTYDDIFTSNFAEAESTGEQITNKNGLNPYDEDDDFDFEETLRIIKSWEIYELETEVILN